MIIVNAILLALCVGVWCYFCVLCFLATADMFENVKQIAEDTRYLAKQKRKENEVPEEQNLINDLDVVVSPEEFEKILEMSKHPREPTQALKEAFEKYGK